MKKQNPSVFQGKNDMQRSGVRKTVHEELMNSA